MPFTSFESLRSTKSSNFTVWQELKILHKNAYLALIGDGLDINSRSENIILISIYYINHDDSLRRVQSVESAYFSARCLSLSLYTSITHINNGITTTDPGLNVLINSAENLNKPVGCAKLQISSLP